MNRIALITGASSGFGEAMARSFAAAGWQLILTGRRAERLRQLQRELQDTHGNSPHLLCFDIRDRQAVAQAIETLPEALRKVDLLVNNAGLASGLGPINSGDIDDWERMIDTNLKGLLYITRAVVPGMVARRSGHIINIGSTAGKEAYPNGNVYCATKHAVDALTKGMRIDLVPHGIKVTQIAPGAADTEFSTVRFHGDAERAAQVYQGFTPLHAEDIAALTLHAASLPAHVCINDMVVTCTAQANSTTIVRG